MHEDGDWMRKSFGELLIVILYKNIPNSGILSVRHIYKIIRGGERERGKNI